MASKKSSEEIEAELRKMINKEPQQNFAELQDKHEIEADLKRMLNMHQSVVVTKEDLLSIKTSKNVTESKKQHVKKKEKKKHHPDVDPGHHHHHHQHQEEPLAAASQENQPVVKKKKRPKKKKTKDATKVIEDPDKEDKDSEDSEEEEDRTPPKQQFNPDFSRAKYLDDKLTAAVLNELESERIFPLKKKSSKFVNAKYFCRLCEYHCDNIDLCRQHASDKRHKRRKEIMVQDKMLKNLPLPSERHIEALDDLVENIYSEHGLSDTELKYRQTVADLIQDILREKLPDVTLYMFGSSVSGLGLKTADLNMDLVIPKGANPALHLSGVYRILMQSEQCSDVRSDFQAKVPAVLFTSPCGTLQCQITIGNEQACQTSQYLAIYTQLDDRVRKLAVTFKFWAKVCELDNQDRGSLPAYCFGLMTIFYLQQCYPPVLPVLWKDLSEQALKRPKTKEDVQNMLQELKQKPWKLRNEDTIGTLWKDLLMFYGLHFDLAENTICVRSLKIIPRAEKKWKSRRIAIEDPFANRRNVARSLHNLRMFDYFYNCLRKAGLYFSLPTSHQNLSKYYESKRKTSHKAKEIERRSRLKSVKTSQISIDQTGSGSQPETRVLVPENIGTILNDENSKKTELDSNSVEKENDNKAVKGDEENSKTIDSDLIICDDISSDNSIKENLLFENYKVHNSGTSSEQDSSLKGETDTEKGDDSIVQQLDNFTIKDKENDEVGVSSSKNLIVDTIKDKAVCDKEQSKTHVNDDGADVSKCINCGATIKNVTETSPVENDREWEYKCPKCALTDPSSNVRGNNLEEPLLALDERTSKSCNEVKQDQMLVYKEIANKFVKEILDYAVESVANSRKDTEKSITVTENKAGQETNKAVEKAIEEITSGKPKASDTSSGLSSDNDMEAESPDSSPMLKRKLLVSSPVGAEYDFKFDSDTLTDGKGPSVFCPLCEKEGHLKANCPEDELPGLKKLPPVTPRHLQLLTKAIQAVPEDFKLSREEISDREFIRKNLEVHIQGLYPDAQLTLFGSSMNGFGFHQSDLDICVTFKDKTPEEIDFVEHIEAICKNLKIHRGLYGVFPITTAKVPIVKFMHRNSQLEGDISMYNILAVENTRLLYTYASIDPRVQTLGYAIKVFAKVCDIGDASRGSLSSYAYMLMMIHYLQHTKPPLIPVLQELYTENGPKPEHIVEGCNTWFYDDISKLPNVWPDCGKNNQSVGELWLGFFRYYLEEFNMAEQVVTIRQLQPLTKFEKLWNGKCIAIEDPFDISHNLGGGLTRKMSHYIQCTYIHARELYGTTISGQPDGFQTIQDYFFEQSQLVVGKPPSDRLCRVCGKIGHIAKECPRLLARKEKEAAERKRRAEMKKTQNDGSPQANTGNRQFQNRDGQNTQRSLADPVNGGSPLRGQGQQQFYQRQNSHHSQSPDSRQKRPLLDTPVKGHQNFQGPRSPHHDFQQQYGSNRHPLSNSQRGSSSPGQFNPGYRQQGYRNQNNQQYFPDNRNDNSSQRYYRQGQHQTRNDGRYFVNQNYDNRSQNVPMNHPSSPSGNRPQFRNQFYEGSPQVYYASGNTENEGIPMVYYTNPPNNIPGNVFLPHMFVNSSMAVNHAYKPLVPFFPPSMINAQNNGVPVSPAGWFPNYFHYPVYDEQSASGGQKTGLEQEVNSEQDSLLETGQLSEPSSSERRVNVQKGANKEKAPDFGITVKNEYYNNKKE